MQKTIGDVWDPQRLVILVLKSLFCTENHKWGLGQIETTNSDAKVAVLNAKTTDEDWDT